MPSKNKSKDILGTYHIAQHPELYTPARSNVFVFMPIFKKDLYALGTTATTAKSYEKFSANIAQETLMLSVDSAAVPNFTQNVIEVKRGNGTIYFAGAYKYDAGSFKFNDYVGANTKGILQAWREQSAHVEDESVGTAEEYKIQAKLIEYTPDHRMIRYWDMFGVWCSDLKEDDFDMNNDGKRLVTATIVYDRATPHLPDDMEEITFTSSPSL